MRLFKLLLVFVIYPLISVVNAQPLPRPATVQLDPAANWQFGAPQWQPELEQFFLRRNCELWMYSWFIYDSKQGKRLNGAETQQLYPEYSDISQTIDCGFVATPAEIETALDIKLPQQAGPVFIYLDFNNYKGLHIFVTPEKLAMHQQRINAFGRLQRLPKYFILTPTKGVRPQGM